LGRSCGTGNAGSDSNAETIRLLSLLVMSGHWWTP
jgi:hypothetical protein